MEHGIIGWKKEHNSLICLDWPIHIYPEKYMKVVIPKGQALLWCRCIVSKSGCIRVLKKIPVRYRPNTARSKVMIIAHAPLHSLVPRPSSYFGFGRPGTRSFGTHNLHKTDLIARGQGSSTLPTPTSGASSSLGCPATASVVRTTRTASCANN